MHCVGITVHTEYCTKHYLFVTQTANTWSVVCTIPSPTSHRSLVSGCWARGRFLTANGQIMQALSPRGIVGLLYADTINCTPLKLHTPLHFAATLLQAGGNDGYMYCFLIGSFVYSAHVYVQSEYCPSPMARCTANMPRMSRLGGRISFFIKKSLTHCVRNVFVDCFRIDASYQLFHPCEYGMR